MEVFFENAPEMFLLDVSLESGEFPQRKRNQLLGFPYAVRKEKNEYRKKNLEVLEDSGEVREDVFAHRKILVVSPHIQTKKNKKSINNTREKKTSAQPPPSQTKEKEPSQLGFFGSSASKDVKKSLGKGKRAETGGFSKMEGWT